MRQFLPQIAMKFRPNGCELSGGAMIAKSRKPFYGVG